MAFMGIFLTMLPFTLLMLPFLPIILPIALLFESGAADGALSGLAAWLADIGIMDWLNALAGLFTGG